MKIQTLLIALAVASGGAIAADTYGSATTTTTTTTTTEKATVHKKKAAKKLHHKKHHHANVAKAHHGHTTAMGAGPASPQTDLEAGARQARMDAAYAAWQKKS